MRPRTVRLHISLPAAHERMRVRIPRNANRVAGFAVDALAFEMVDELRIHTPVEIAFDGLEDPPQAELTRFPRGPLQIRLASRKTIRRHMPELSEREVSGKIVAQLAEELCHFGGGRGGNHETCHNKRVVGCTLKLMRKHISERDLRLPYLKEKQAVLRRSPREPRSVRCPV